MLTRIFKVAAGITCMVVLLLNPVAAGAQAMGDSDLHVVSEQGLFKVAYRSSLEPVVINEMHEWTLQVFTADGEPVDDASITISGGMPAHNHGLPTNPQVTENLGDGRYRVEGLRFHMRGDWELVLDISSGDQSDSVRIAFRL